MMAVPVMIKMLTGVSFVLSSLSFDMLIDSKRFQKPCGGDKGESGRRPSSRVMAAMT
jgi:hypothetical protein